MNWGCISKHPFFEPTTSCLRFLRGVIPAVIGRMVAHTLKNTPFTKNLCFDSKIFSFYYIDFLKLHQSKDDKAPFPHTTGKNLFSAFPLREQWAAVTVQDPCWWFNPQSNLFMMSVRQESTFKVFGVTWLWCQTPEISQSRGRRSTTRPLSWYILLYICALSPLYLSPQIFT